MKVWTVMSMLDGAPVGLAGVFSSFVLAEAAAVGEMIDIAKAAHLTGDWTGSRSGDARIHENGPWDVVVWSWELDKVERARLPGEGH